MDFHLHCDCTHLQCMEMDNLNCKCARSCKNFDGFAKYGFRRRHIQSSQRLEPDSEAARCLIRQLLGPCFVLRSCFFQQAARALPAPPLQPGDWALALGRTAAVWAFFDSATSIFLPIPPIPRFPPIPIPTPAARPPDRPQLAVCHPLDQTSQLHFFSTEPHLLKVDLAHPAARQPWG